jgi:hypothetical protein
VDLPFDSILIGIIGAISAIALKLFFNKKQQASRSTPPPPRPVDKTVHTAATRVVEQRFDEAQITIDDANDDDEDRLQKLSDLTNLAKRR